MTIMKILMVMIVVMMVIMMIMMIMLLTSNKSMAEYNLSEVYEGGFLSAMPLFMMICRSTSPWQSTTCYRRIPLSNAIDHDDVQEPIVREAKARLQEKYQTAQQLGQEV